MNKFRNIGLTTRLSIVVLACSILVYLVVFGIGYSLIHRLVINNIENTGKNIVNSAVRDVNDIVEVVARISKSMDSYLQISPTDKDKLFEAIEMVLINNDELSGLSISFEPYSANPKNKYYSPYCFSKNGQIKCEMIGSDNYDYFNMNWYKETKLSGTAVWTDPYLDSEYSNIYILSHSAPFYEKINGKKIFRGIVSADISLPWLQNMISKAAGNRKGYAFLISQTGTFITFPEQDYALKKSIWDIAKEENSSDLNKIAYEMTTGKTGVKPFNDFITGERSWIFYKPVVLSGWSIGIVFSEKTLFSKAYLIVHWMMALYVFGMIILCIAVFILSQRITKPLIRLSANANQIASGNLDTNIPSTIRRDEIGILARSFSSMQDNLKKHIKMLTETVAHQERINNELKIAHDIQQSIVPKEFSTIGLADNIKAFGKLVPARQVGGDLYDCYKIDDRHTFFVIGDVSDKGVHASLIMAIVLTLLKGLSKNLHNPSSMLEIANKQILKKNQESMFVTLFCGILDNETGEFKYANAGHIPPILINKKRTVPLLSEHPNMPLGVKINAKFTWETITLENEDKIFMYTDGVTDACNKTGEFFGEERLLNSLENKKNETPEKLVNSIFTTVTDHADKCPLPDDIALLCFSFSSTFSHKTNIQINNTENEIRRVSQLITEFGIKHHCNKEMLHEVDLATEEIIINIIHYAYHDKKEHIINVSMEINATHFIVTITDDGKPFNPWEAKDPDTGLALKDRPIGGLGIFFAKKMADSVHYERIKNRNQITITKTI